MSNKFIIPLILDEDTVKVLPDNIIESLARNSGNIVMLEIKKYTSLEDCDPVIRDRLNKAFSGKFSILDHLSSNELMDSVEMIAELTYEDIYFERDWNYLKKLREAIQYILNDDRSVPFLEPVGSKDVVQLLEELSAFEKTLTEVRNTHAANLVRNLKNNISKMKPVFKDARNYNKGTVVKRIIKERTKYDVICKGIDFCISKKGKDPRSWRYL